MYKFLVVLISISSTASALKCYNARLTLTQAGASEELPLDAKLDSGCSSCQRIKFASEAGGPMPAITTITWSCEVPRAIVMVMPACPGQTPAPTLPPMTTPKEGAPPPLCSEMVSRTKMTSSPIMSTSTTTTMCGCCQDNCNKSPGCQLDWPALSGLKAPAPATATAASGVVVTATLSNNNNNNTAAAVVVVLSTNDTAAAAATTTTTTKTSTATILTTTTKPKLLLFHRRAVDII